MKEDTLKHWETVASREAFVASPWVKVEVQQVRLPGGKLVDDFHRVTLQEYVTVFAETSDARVILERQYKHGIGRVTFTLPGGALTVHEDPLEAAKRELLEETGYAADDWRPLGSFVVNGNYGCGKAHLFMARQAVRIAEPNSGDLEEMEIVLMDAGQVASLVRSGEIGSISGVATVALATNASLWPLEP